MIKPAVICILLRTVEIFAKVELKGITLSWASLGKHSKK
jgi:hypothetical protein